MTLGRALGTITDLGLELVDLGALRGVCEHVNPDADETELSAASNIIRRSGVRPAAVNADPEAFDEQSAAVVLPRVERLAAFCADIGAPVLMLPGGRKGVAGRGDTVFLSQVADGLVAANEVCNAYGVRLAVEAPHYLRTVKTFDLVHALLDRIADPTFITFDTSHVRASGADPVMAFHAEAKRVAHIQLRDAVPGDMRRFIGGGDISFSAFFHQTFAVNYNGSYILESETRNSPYDSKHDEVVASMSALVCAFKAALA